MNYRFTKIIAVFALALLPVAASAAQLKGSPSGALAVVEAVDDDVYAAGSSVSLTAPVNGDAVLAGASVLVGGTVSESILAAAGTVNVSGSVGDDIRVIGGNIFVNGAVSRDAVIVGGQISIAPTATIGKDLIVLGGTVALDGTVNGNVIIRGGDVTINGTVKGSVDASARSVVFGANASIGGKLKYSSVVEAQTAMSVAGGGVEYKKMAEKVRQPEKSGNSFGIFLVLAIVAKIISLFVLALIVWAVFKKKTMAFVQGSFAQFGWDLLRGFTAAVAMPAAAFVLLITLIGAPVAILMISAYAILAVLSGILAPIILGSFIFKFAKKSAAAPVGAYSILAGSAAYALIDLVPVLGWAFGIVFMLAAFGGLVRMAIAALSKAQN
jgi:hypothetical protein